MEGSESKVIFDLIDLNPQLFINEVLYNVDDLVDDAFYFFHQEEDSLLKTDDTHRSDDLSKGVDYVTNIIERVLDKRFEVWEEYIIRHCFVVPEAFVLPKGDDLPSDSLMNPDDLSDPKLDAELDSLREKLRLVHEESGNISIELQALETQPTLSNSCSQFVNELYEQHSINETFHEFVRTASEFRTKLNKLKVKRKECKLIRKQNVQISNGDLFRSHDLGLSNATIEQLQEFIADITK